MLIIQWTIHTEDDLSSLNYFPPHISATDFSLWWRKTGYKSIYTHYTLHLYTIPCWFTFKLDQIVTTAPCLSPLSFISMVASITIKGSSYHYHHFCSNFTNMNLIKLKRFCFSLSLRSAIVFSHLSVPHGIAFKFKAGFLILNVFNLS